MKYSAPCVVSLWLPTEFVKEPKLFLLAEVNERGISLKGMPLFLFLQKKKMEKTILVKDKYFKKFISEATIQAKVKEIAAEMSITYAQRNPLFIAVLNGSFMLASDIMKAMEVDAEITFIKLASYENMSSTGAVNTLIGLKNNLEGRDVIIVEDIIDSGRTMHYFLESLETKNPKSVAIFTLLHKPTATIFDLNIDYIGFSIEDKFVIGYGLDYDEAGRQYPDIYQLA